MDDFVAVKPWLLIWSWIEVVPAEKVLGLCAFFASAGLRSLSETPFIRNPFELVDVVCPCDVDGRGWSTSTAGSSNTPIGDRIAVGAIGVMLFFGSTGIASDFSSSSDFGRGASSTIVSDAFDSPALDSVIFESESILDVLFLNDGMLFRPLEMTRRTPAPVSPDCCFSCLSISPNMVVPLMAKFSSGIGWNLTMPRSGGTLKISAMNDWIKAAFRLFIVGPICEGTVDIDRM